MLHYALVSPSLLPPPFLWSPVHPPYILITNYLRPDLEVVKPAESLVIPIGADDGLTSEFEKGLIKGLLSGWRAITRNTAVSQDSEGGCCLLPESVKGGSTSWNQKRENCVKRAPDRSRTFGFRTEPGTGSPQGGGYKCIMSQLLLALPS